MYLFIHYLVYLSSKIAFTKLVHLGKTSSEDPPYKKLSIAQGNIQIWRWGDGNVLSQQNCSQEKLCDHSLAQTPDFPCPNSWFPSI